MCRTGFQPVLLLLVSFISFQDRLKTCSTSRTKNAPTSGAILSSKSNNQTQIDLFPAILFPAIVPRYFFFSLFLLPAISSSRYFFFPLFLLLDMEGMSPQTGRILLQTELFATRPAANRVIVVAGLFADQKHRFRLLFVLSHRKTPQPTNTAAARMIQQVESRIITANHQVVHTHFDVVIWQGYRLPAPLARRYNPRQE